MFVYCVSYDLRKAGQNYSGLYEQLKSTKWLHPLESTWLVATTESAQQLSDRLWMQLDANDLLLVIRVTKPYWGVLPKEAWAWIEVNVPTA